jgi:nicotinamidase-related amidase
MSRYTEPDWSSAALITIDTQCDTLDGQPFEIPGTSAVLPRMAALLDAFRTAGRPIVHIARLYQADGSNVDLCRRALVEEGTALVLAGSPGCQLAPDLLPRPGIELDAERLLSGDIQTLTSQEVVIYKPRWGAFYQTPLEVHLRRHGVSTLVFSGCNYPNCPRTSIYEASERDFRVVLVEDAVSGLYDRGRREMTNIGVELLSTGAVVEAITQMKPRS